MSYTDKDRLHQRVYYERYKDSPEYKARIARNRQAYLERNRNLPEYRAMIKTTKDTRTMIHRYQSFEYLGGVCTDCGYKENLNALEFDHVEPRQGPTIPNYFTYSWDSLKKQLDKCELVCATCHAIRTANRRKMAVAVTSESTVSSSEASV